MVSRTEPSPPFPNLKGFEAKTTPNWNLLSPYIIEILLPVATLGCGDVGDVGDAFFFPSFLQNFFVLLSVLLFAHVKRFSVSRMKDFFLNRIIIPILLSVLYVCFDQSKSMCL